MREITVLTDELRKSRMECEELKVEISRMKDKLPIIPAPETAAVPFHEIWQLLNEAMDRAVANGANSISMPDSYVSIAHFLFFPEKYAAQQPPAEPVNMRLLNDAKWVVEAANWNLMALAMQAAVYSLRESIAAAEQQAQYSRDWVEDFSHENGQYMCKCCHCGKSFIGHKRRVVCKACDLAEQAQPEPCNTCNGSGYTDSGDPETGEIKNDYPCPDCIKYQPEPLVTWREELNTIAAILEEDGDEWGCAGRIRAILSAAEAKRWNQ